ncbi:MAG: lysine--tRNA ligase, partial [Candidatus Eremiobacteraeota bacterium]|nr:lysine--tRNA ligase [Candidatus Eremiobacteraeota bacterium]
MSDVLLPAVEDAGEVGQREGELRAARRQNLAALVENGADPFHVTRYDVTAHAAQLASSYADLTADTDRPPSERVGVAGRLMALRKQGKKVFFADLWDRTGKLQLYVRQDVVGDATFERFDMLDLGDIVGARGTLFRTKSGELTLRVESLEVLTKALVPLPDKHHGLQDVEKRYRQRYVDLIVNEHVR